MSTESEQDAAGAAIGATTTTAAERSLREGASVLYAAHAAPALHHAAELERGGDYHAWAQALVLADAVRAARLRDGPAGARTVLCAAVDVSGLDPSTLRRRVMAIDFLRDHDLGYVATERRLSIGIVAKVVTHAHATPDEKVGLIKDFHEALVADPARKGVRADIERRLQALRPAKDEDWKRSTDFWPYGSCGARTGHDGLHDRLPGQAVRNILDRFLPEGGRFLSAYTGDGAPLDAAAATKKVGAYRGFDLVIDPRVAERHAGLVSEFDGTRVDWTPACSAGPMDLVLVTPPPFRFVRLGATTSPTDLGNINDPDEWLGAMRCVVGGGASVLVPGGVIAIALKSTADFGGKGPVPNLLHDVTAMIEAAVGGNFLGHAIVTTGRTGSRAAHDGDWLTPEVWHLVIYRGT